MKETIKGGGTVISETRQLAPFTGVRIHGSDEVNITFGPMQQVTVTGYENLLPIYETTLIGGILNLQFRPDLYNVRNSNIKVNITMPALDLLTTNGSGKMLAENFKNGDALTASIGGSGNIYVKNCKYRTVTYRINGSGNIKAATTESDEAVAEISGAGNIELKVNKKLKAFISGSGNVNYWGNPLTIISQVSGSGVISKK